MARFRREQRLTRRGAFQRVFDHPVRSSDSLLTVLARPNGLPYARLGLAVGRRRLPRAIDRNTFKRIVRESFRANQQFLVGLDLVVLARSGAVDANRQMLRESIERQWADLRRRNQ